MNIHLVAVIISLIQLNILYRYSYTMSKVSKVGGYKVVLVGATGCTGQYLLSELIKAKEFKEITVLGRRKASLPKDVGDGVDLNHEEDSGRVKQIMVDMENISDETFGEYFENKDVFFTTLGTTRRQAGSASAFRHVDYELNYKLAKLAKERNVRLFTLLSSQGANKESYFLYPQVKGELEHDCSLLEFPHFSIFRPGFLDRGNESRYLEKFAGWFMSRLPVQKLARALCSNALQHLSSISPDSSQVYMYYNDQIIHMSDSYELNE